MKIADILHNKGYESKRTEKSGGELWKDKRTWLKPTKTRNSIRAIKNCWPQTSLADDGSISSKRKLVDTLLYNMSCQKRMTSSHFIAATEMITVELSLVYCLDLYSKWKLWWQSTILSQIFRYQIIQIICI